jgi:hypothetical protein
MTTTSVPFLPRNSAADSSSSRFGRCPSFQNPPSTYSKKTTPKPLSTRKIVMATGPPSGAGGVRHFGSGIQSWSCPLTSQDLRVGAVPFLEPLYPFVATSWCAPSDTFIRQSNRLFPALLRTHASCRVRKSWTAHKDSVRQEADCRKSSRSNGPSCSNGRLPLQ